MKVFPSTEQEEGIFNPQCKCVSLLSTIKDRCCNDDGQLLPYFISFYHIFDFPPCREQLWDKSISHGFLAWSNVPWSVKYARKCILYGFPCEMDFSPLVSESHPRGKWFGGIWRLVGQTIHLKWKTIQNAYHGSDVSRTYWGVIAIFNFAIVNFISLPIR